VPFLFLTSQLYHPAFFGFHRTPTPINNLRKNKTGKFKIRPKKKKMEFDGPEKSTFPGGENLRQPRSPKPKGFKAVTNFVVRCNASLHARDLDEL